MNASAFLGYAKIAAIAVGAYVIVKGVKSGYSYIDQAIPQVVKDGTSAAGQMIIYGVHTIGDPLDTFGVSPATGSDGQPLWEKTYPWATTSSSSNDPVSNNDSGINYNLF